MALIVMVRQIVKARRLEMMQWSLRFHVTPSYRAPRARIMVVKRKLRELQHSSSPSQLFPRRNAKETDEI